MKPVASDCRSGADSTRHCIGIVSSEPFLPQPDSSSAEQSSSNVLRGKFVTCVKMYGCTVFTHWERTFFTG